MGPLVAHLTRFFFLFLQQLKNAISSQLKGFQVRTEMSNHVRGYQGLKLRRARRSRPGYEFGGRDTQQRVENYMAA